LRAPRERQKGVNMNNSLVGLIGIVLVVLIAESVGIFLRRPLGFLLRAEKGTERSDFWNAYARVVLLLVPAFFALVSFPDDARIDPILGLVGELRWGLAGLLISLAVAAKTLMAPAKPRTAPYVPPTHPPTAPGPTR
jgi:hypothetical protein